MTVTTRFIEYESEGATYEGAFAIDDAQSGPRPAVLVAHAWAGRSEFEVEKAKALAGLGYAGFAIDLYGKGVLGSSTEENQKLMTPFLEDRAMLQARLKAWVDVAKQQAEVDGSNIAAIGFCFGGLCVLDMARVGADIKGVVSFHGLFNQPDNAGGDIHAKVLALHGWDDPMAPPADVEAFAKEMTDAKADWQLHAYGGTMHAFTNPGANDPNFGTVYNADADRRSWGAMQDFLAELFA